MSKRDQVADYIEGALPMVGGNRVHPRDFDGTADCHSWYTLTHQVSQNFVSHLGSSRCDDQSVYAMIYKGSKAGGLLFNAPAGESDECAVSGFIQNQFRTIHKLCREWVCDVRQKNTNRAKPLTPELSRHHVRPIFEFRGSFQDALADTLAYIAGLVQSTGSGHCDDSRKTCDVR
jgi:hypothetical protein